MDVAGETTLVIPTAIILLNLFKQLETKVKYQVSIQAITNGRILWVILALAPVSAMYLFGMPTTITG